MIRQRVTTAVVLAAGLLLVLFVLPLTASAAVLGVLMGIGAWEWSALAGLRAVRTRGVYVALAVTAGLAAATATHHEDLWYWLLMADVCAWLLSLVWMLRYPVAVPQWFSFISGLIALPIGWLILLHLLELWGGVWALLVFGIVAAADVGAFFAGRRFGRLKLAPAVSPGKTWEGVAGGLLLVGLVAGSVAPWLGIGSVQGVLAAIVVAAFSILGDLTVSMLKRSAGLKDSGNIFPGHGGVLDRIDSLLAALPLYVLLFEWITRR